MAIEILQYTPINKPPLIGNVNIRLVNWGIDLLDCPYFESKRGRSISLPKREKKDNTGKRAGWIPTIRFVEESVFQRFQVEALQALDDYMKSRDPEATDSAEDIPF